MPPVRFWIVLFVFLSGACLRSLASSGELWLDEIWNLDASFSMSSPFDVYFKRDAHLDGHSSLETVLLAFFQPGLADYVYRLPSLFFSIGLLLLLSLSTLKEKQWQRLLTGCLLCVFASLSYLLVVYGTEIRGYSGMLFFITLSFLSLKRFSEERGTLGTAFVFSLSAIIAFLFHYSAITYYVSTLVWSLFLMASQPRPQRQRLALAHVLCLCAIGLMYLTVVRHLPEGTGPRPSYFDTFVSSLSVTGGGPVISPVLPSSIPWILLIALTVLLIGVYEIRAREREGRSDWIFFACVVFYFPVLLVVLKRPDVVHPRYFLTASYFWQWLFASFIVRSWYNTRISRVGAAILSIVFIITNSYSLLQLYFNQRGRYRSIIDIVASPPESADETLLVVDHEFRHRYPLEYYRGNRSIKIIDEDQIDRETSYRWYLRHSLDWGEVAPPSVTLHNRQTFTLYREYSAPQLTSWRVMVYKAQSRIE